MNHSAYISKTRKMDDDALRFTISDARQALEAMPENPKAGYYADEIHYCAMELKRRADKAPKFTFRFQPPIAGTIINGNTGTIIKGAEIVADFIELDSGYFFVTDLNGNDYSGARDEITAALS